MSTDKVISMATAEITAIPFNRFLGL